MGDAWEGGFADRVGVLRCLALASAWAGWGPRRPCGSSTTVAGTAGAMAATPLTEQITEPLLRAASRAAIIAGVTRQSLRRVSRGSFSATPVDASRALGSTDQSAVCLMATALACLAVAVPAYRRRASADPRCRVARAAAGTADRSRRRPATSLVGRSYHRWRPPEEDGGAGAIKVAPEYDDAPVHAVELTRGAGLAQDGCR
jgi:hypothetical protein